MIDIFIFFSFKHTCCISSDKVSMDSVLLDRWYSKTLAVDTFLLPEAWKNWTAKICTFLDLLRLPNSCLLKTIGSISLMTVSISSFLYDEVYSMNMLQNVFPKLGNCLVSPKMAKCAKRSAVRRFSNWFFFETICCISTIRVWVDSFILFRIFHNMGGKSCTQRDRFFLPFANW